MVVPAEADAQCLLARAYVCCPALECSQSGDLFGHPDPSDTKGG